MKKIKKTDIVLGGIVYRKVDNGYGVYTYTEDLPEIVVVPEEIEGEPITVLMEKCFADSRLCRIILPDSLRKIEDWAFRKAMNLTEVKIPDGVTTVGYAVFKQCKNLRYLDLGRHTKTVGSNLCEHCKSIEEFILWDDLESIGYDLFVGGGKKLKYTEFSHGLYLGNPENPYVMLTGHVSFKKESDPLTVEIHPNTKLITNIAFNRFRDGAVYFDEIDRLILHDGIQNIQSGAFWFSQFDHFQGNWGPELLADSIEMLCRVSFAANPSRKLIVDGKEIRNLVIPATVKSIAEHTFSNCQWLESVTFEGNIEEIGNSAFSHCKQLKSLQFCGSVGTIHHMAFYSCSSLEKLELPEVNEINSHAFSEGQGLRELRFKGKVGHVKGYAFAGNQHLETVEGMENIQTVEEDSDPFRYTPFEGKLK